LADNPIISGFRSAPSSYVVCLWRPSQYGFIVGLHGSFPNSQCASNRRGNIVTIPHRTPNLETSFEKYDGTDILSPLQSARFRILDHIKKLRNNSVTNLFIGIGIAAVGIIILFTAIFQIGQFVDTDKHDFDTNGFVFFALLPKLSVTVFVQIFSYFFLAMYRANQNDINIFRTR
jgi:hypothetical protein